jgi:hypothetical protein
MQGLLILADRISLPAMEHSMFNSSTGGGGTATKDQRMKKNLKLKKRTGN